MAKSKYRAKGPRHDASRALIEQKLRNKRNKSRREKENVGGVSLTVALAVAAAVAALVLAGGAADSLGESPNPRSDRGLGADVDITFENQYHRPVDVYLEDQCKLESRHARLARQKAQPRPRAHRRLWAAGRPTSPDGIVVYRADASRYVKSAANWPPRVAANDRPPTRTQVNDSGGQNTGRTAHCRSPWP